MIVYIFTPPPIGERSRPIVMTVSVCDHYLRNHMSDLHQIFMQVTYVCGSRSSSGGVAIHYALPVLWMTSWLWIMARNRRRSSD